MGVIVVFVRVEVGGREFCFEGLAGLGFLSGCCFVEGFFRVG